MFKGPKEGNKNGPRKEELYTAYTCTHNIHAPKDKSSVWEDTAQG